jgi:hypothetical protein
MPRKKGGTAWTKTLIVRISERQDEDLRIAAGGLGMDVSNLVRLLFTEHVPEYIARGEDAAQRAASARERVAKPKPAKPTDSDEQHRNLEV